MRLSRRAGIKIGFGLVLLILGVMTAVWFRSAARMPEAAASNLLFLISALLGLAVWVAVFFLVRAEIDRYERAEVELREREQFLSSIIENVPDMIFVKEARNLRYILFNKAGETLLGHSKEELAGKNDYDFFPKEQANFFTAKDRKVFEEKKLVDIPEEAIRTRCKGTRILHTKKIPVYDKDERPLYLLGISQDITDQR